MKVNLDNFESSNGGTQWCKVGKLDGTAVAAVACAIVDNRHQEDSTFGLINRNLSCGYQQNSSPSAQANRLCYRSRGILWCIGDKARQFPVRKDCPSQGRLD
jgi:hypothetical protein